MATLIALTRSRPQDEGSPTPPRALLPRPRTGSRVQFSPLCRVRGGRAQTHGPWERAQCLGDSRGPEPSSARSGGRGGGVLWHEADVAHAREEQLRLTRRRATAATSSSRFARSKYVLCFEGEELLDFPRLAFRSARRPMEFLNGANRSVPQF